MALGDIMGKTVPEKASKRDQMVSRLVRLGIMAALGIVFAGALAYGLSSWEASKQKDRDTARAQANEMSAQVTKLEQKLTQTEKFLPLYTQMKEVSGKPELPLDRLKAKEFLDKLAEAYVFSGLRVTLSPVRDLEKTYKNTKVQGMACDMTLAFEGLSDAHVFALLADMRKRYLGLVKITGISATRSLTPDAAVLRNIAQNGKVILVKGDVKLQWLGLKALKPAQPAPGKPAPPPAAGAAP